MYYFCTSTYIITVHTLTKLTASALPGTQCAHPILTRLNKALCCTNFTTHKCGLHSARLSRTR